MNTFLTSNKAVYRFLRTLVQCIAGYVVANIDMLIGTWNFQPDTQILIASAVVMILSPVMKALGTEDEKMRDESYNRPEMESEEDAD